MSARDYLTEFEAPPAAAPVIMPTALTFHVVIDPRKPAKESAGGIVLPKTTRRANRATDFVGRLVAVGSLAFKAKTPDLDLSLEPNWPKVGDWVAFRQHAGQKMRIRQDHATMVKDDTEDEDYLMLMDDTDILAVFKSEEDARQFYSWV